jgi:uncharacterized membrane protein YeiH
MPPRTITAQEARVSTLLLVLDLAGATAGVRRRLDVFGVAVLSFATACSGGIARDVLIGAVPPAAHSDWRYVAASLLAGLLVFRWHALCERLQSPVCASSTPRVLPCSR